ncbi:MAG TPA: heme o synthase [Chloroflexota bacterium]
MALVVTARSTPVVLAGETRLGSWFRRLTLVATGWAVLAFGGHSIARALPAVALAQDAVAVAWIILGLLTIGVAALAWLEHRRTPGLLLLTTLAPIAVALRLLASGIFVALDLNTLADLVEGAAGLIVLGLLVWAVIAALPEPRRGAPTSLAAEDFFRRVIEVTTVVIFALGLSGSAVQALGASWACQGFPDCNSLGALPLGRDPLADVQLYHRLFSYLAGGLVLWLAVEAMRSQRHQPVVVRATLALTAALGLEAAIGARAVTTGVPALAQVLHGFGAIGTWSAAIALLALAHRKGKVVVLPEARRQTSVLSAYVQLTKPRVMSLLLATTATAMIVAARGLPPLELVLATLLGGALMSGGAGAINHYVDRDIDPLMGRTAWRPIPSGVIAPRHALWFGIVLTVLATIELVVLVNPLAAVLSLIGLLGYVFIYTLWLKRSSPSNIVIGGAAGAIPPMVGWAAVNNEITSLTAWYLFAIIFFWTPPHFWALSLLIRKHYERAGIPMLPVVRGEEETRRQIVMYTLVLVALTLVLSPFGLMGLVYFGAAVVLGAMFIGFAVRLWRLATPQAARRLYLYSMLYLFALFTAMAVDRVIS